MNKRDVRKEAKKRINNLTSKKVNDLSLIIQNEVLKRDIYKNANSIFIYNSYGKEVKTDLLIEKSLQLNKKVYLPKIIDDQMFMVEINHETEYEKGVFDILEPKGNIYDGDVDLTIVPLLAIDKQNNRVGKGKGYYDRFLSSHKTYALGICFNVQVFDKINSEEWDYRINEQINEGSSKYEDN